ncbi:MAG: helix-turn-helix domain-containing protein [Myxococcota bacterium]
MAGTIRERVGRRLATIRQRAGLTQAGLGERVGMAAAEISKYERARRSPSLESLERLATALGVTVRELVGDEEGRPSDEAVEQIALRLRGQPEVTRRQAVAIVDALVRAR